MSCGTTIGEFDPWTRRTRVLSSELDGLLRPLAVNYAGQSLVSVRKPTNRSFPFDYHLGTALLSGSQYWQLNAEWYPIRLNNAGRSILRRDFGYSYAVWEDPTSMPRLLQPPVLGVIQGSAWNDFEQTVVIDSDNTAYLWNTRSGETVKQVHRLASATALNARGCIAGHTPARENADANGDFVIVCGDTIQVVEPEGVVPTVIGMNEHGWLVYRRATLSMVWDGVASRAVEELLPQHLKDYGASIATGINNQGWFVMRSSQEYSSPYYLMRPVEPIDTFTEILKPESGPEVTGHGEYVGCEAMTGWVYDASRPGMAPAVELYEDTRLIGATVALPELRTDGVYGFHVEIPRSIVADGKPHFFNVRFAGTATAVEQAWGMIQCPAN
jgi:hypothetical protein